MKRNKSKQKKEHTRERSLRAANQLKPKTDNQREFMAALNSKAMVCGIGCAGTGKTYIAGMIAVQKLLRNDIDKIILTRPNVSTGKSLGSFPGDVSEKMAPWLAPILNVLKIGLGAGDYECRMGKSILIQPLETIRGQSFDDAFVIVDESQNLEMEEIKAIVTRLGENTTLALIGDPNQSDIKNGTALTKFVNLCNKTDIDVPLVEFGFEDIVRSDICSDMIKMFHTHNL
jgi:phosphate starvation-inducible PhoH-like protein